MNKENLFAGVDVKTGQVVEQGNSPIDLERLMDERVEQTEKLADMRRLIVKRIREIEAVSESKTRDLDVADLNESIRRIIEIERKLANKETLTNDDYRGIINANGILEKVKRLAELEAVGGLIP